MDRIDLFRIFVRVVDSGSFTRAAVTLGLPRSSVSAAIQELEGRLGTVLLLRNTRSSSLTPDGAHLYERCRPLLADAEEIEHLFRQPASGPAGRVRIDVPSRIGRRIIAPALPALLARYPGLELDLGMSDSPTDPVANGIDCLLRVGPARTPKLACVPLGDLTLVSCASPGYLARHGQPRQATDLDHHLAVGYGLAAGGAPWEWSASGQVHSRTVASRVAVDNVEGYIACGLAGLGLIQVPEYDVRDHLARGDLIEVLADARPAPMPLSLLHPPRERLPARLTIVIEWLASVVGKAVGSPQSPDDTSASIGKIGRRSER